MSRRRKTEQRENHGCRVSVRRAAPDQPFNSGASREVQGLRGGLTPHDLYDFGMWWADQWAMAEPGTVFFVVPSWAGQREYRAVMPRDFPARALPESSAPYDAIERARLAQWDEDYATPTPEPEISHAAD